MSEISISVIGFLVCWLLLIFFLILFQAEASHLLIRNVNYEIPALKRQIAKCQLTQRVRFLSSIGNCVFISLHARILASLASSLSSLWTLYLSSVLITVP